MDVEKRPTRKAEQSEATRGALYHHFGGKRDLLEAVYRQVEEEAANRIAAEILDGDFSSPLEAMRAGAALFIEASADPELQQIVLLDSPSVLGWERWREIAASYGLGLIEASLTAAIEAGEIAPQPVKPLAHVLMGALDEAAMLLARSEDPGTEEEVMGVLNALIDGLAAGRA